MTPEDEESERRSNGISIGIVRIVAFLVIYTTALVGGVSWLLTSSFTNALDSRLDRLALQNSEVYAKRADTVPRGELEIRLELIRQEMRRLEERDTENRKALDGWVASKPRQ